MEQIILDAGLDLRNPRVEALKNVGTILRKENKKGIWLIAPTPLHIDQDRDVIVTGFDFYSTEQRGRRYLGESGIVVATRVESRETFAALIEEQKEPADPNAEPDNTPIPPAESLQRFEILLRERLPDLPWRAGTYLVDVMLDAHSSNRLQFKITPGKAAREDPAIVAYIEAHRAAADGPKELHPAPVGNAKYPDYRKNDRSLELPAAPGIILAPERVSVYKPGASSILRGSFRLPVPSGHYRMGDGEGTAASAGVPITLVITGNLLPGPFVAPLLMPAYTAIDRHAAESIVTGYFEIDLFGLNETSKVPQTYTIWAYSGSVRSAPTTSAVITPEMMK